MNAMVKRIMQTGIIFAICFGLFNLQPASTDGNIDNTYKYAWSTNTGWENFRPAHGGVTVHDAYLSSYAWAENVGYIHFRNVSSEYCVMQEVGAPTVTTLNEWGILVFGLLTVAMAIGMIRRRKVQSGS